MRSRLMDAIRHAFGIAAHAPVRPPSYAQIERRLDEQAARLRAMDAQVDAQRKSNTILSHNRRATDHQ